MEQTSLCRYSNERSRSSAIANVHLNSSLTGILRSVSLLLLVASLCCGAQTQLDLARQSKNVDFSAASATKPIQTGFVLPPTCGVGQMFFSKQAIAGQNLFLCVAINIWSQLNGIAASNATMNFTAGFGALLFDWTPGAIRTVQFNVDPWVVSIKAALSSGPTFCASKTGTTSYACGLFPPLSTYTGPSSNPPGSTCLVLYVDTANTSAPATLNVDALGGVPILGRAGRDLNPGDIPSNEPVTACYNGSAFILQR